MSESVQPGGIRVVHQGSGTLSAIAGAGLVLVLIDVPTRTAVLTHMLLPYASAEIRLSESEPAWFVETGIPYSVNRMLEARSMGESRDFDMVLVGGAEVPGAELGIGRQNIEAASEQFRRYNLEPNLRLVGGTMARKIILNAETCRLKIHDSDGTIHEA